MASRPLTIWHSLIIIFVSYAMMPMALTWCFLCNLTGCLVDLLLTLCLALMEYNSSNNNTLGSQNSSRPPTQPYPNSPILQLLAKFFIYLATNLVCLYTKYLIDLAQRNAFLETRRSMDTRAKIERENDKQERLLLSLLPRFVAYEIIEDIAKQDHDQLLKNQFHKIYIHSYSNVR